jgi:hypothetical protein
MKALKNTLCAAVTMFSLMTLVVTAHAASPNQKFQLTKTFDYAQPLEMDFDQRPALLHDGTIVERNVTGRPGEIYKFSASGQLRDSFEVPFSFHDQNSIVVLSDGTTVLLNCHDKAIYFYGSDRQMKSKVTISQSLNMLSAKLINLGTSVLLYGGSLSYGLDVYSPIGLIQGHITLPDAGSSPFSIDSNGDIAVVFGTDGNQIEFVDTSAHQLRVVTLAGAKHIQAPIFLTDNSMIVACDADAVCTYNPDGSLKWRHNFTASTLGAYEIAVLPENGVHTSGDGAYFFNSDGSVRTHLFPNEIANARGPIEVSSEGFVALYRWHKSTNPSGGDAYAFFDLDGGEIGSINILDFSTSPIAVDGRNFVLADQDHLIGLRIVPYR